MLEILLIGFIISLLILIFSKQKNTVTLINVIFISFYSLSTLIKAVIDFTGNNLIQININAAKFPLSFKMDKLSLFFISVISLISIVSATYGYGYLSHDKNCTKLKIHFFNLFLLIASMQAVVISNNFITFMLAWEIMSISSYFLVIYNYHDYDVRQAGLKYFIFTHIGGLFILSSFAVAYSFTGNFSFTGLAGLSENIKLIVFVLAFIGFASKAGVFPFHIWLPYAHPAAPSHVSALMSGVMIKVGIYAILRLFLLLSFHSAILIVGSLILIFGIISSVAGVIYALGQHDLKKLLAYHSVENIGIILIGLGVGIFGIYYSNNLIMVFGFAGALLHILNHALFKSLLFLGAGSVIHSTGIKTIDKLGGVFKKLKVTSITFLIASIAISGIPPLNGFVSEFLIYVASFKSLYFPKYSFILIAFAIISLAAIGGLAAACFTKVYGTVFLGNPRSKEIERAVETSFTIKTSMSILAILCIIIGLFPYIFVKITANVLTQILPEFAVNDIYFGNFIYLTYIYSAIIFLFIIIWLFKKYLLNKNGAEKSDTWGCGYQFANPKIQYTGSSFASPVLTFYSHIAPIHKSKEQVTGFFPRKISYHSHIIDLSEFVIDKLVIKPFCKASNFFKYIQHGNLQIYIAYILIILFVLLLMI